MSERAGQPPRTDSLDYARAEAELQGSGQVDYGNWVPAVLMRALLMLSGALLLVLALLLITWANLVVLTVVAVACLVSLALTGYLGLCRRRFAFDGGGLMGAMHQLVVDNLDWDGRGGLLDIGCGAGALTIRCAKTFPGGRFTGVDQWGSRWSYAKQQCERNARAENVSDSVTFAADDAARLDFPDGAFDAAVSNFVFHEVRSEPDKRALVREALRVLRPGGVFSFQDMFGHRRLYGDMDAFVQELRDGGITQVEYVPHTESIVGAPAWIRTPWMLRGAGIIHGRK
ncbi:class I SAM-dependent methyltransferase [Propionibacterium australiense]|uniref:Methyltransferase domain n=1 Tax=Propionibacterium australiense TaxID=119981 RepID=A0A383S5N5_9ACTN|nr:class I SAM-dependent methyltransferase [Propionibacterium australiense]RLP09812.1 methyltransferase domain-containing protein [Propionibacterium australiense]RLP10139.1 methyltransferase domain-containing protein [Propionibacterium australiense]SYZ33290.1 Methyltransferase domain [Propionibacterium australiense]VEH89216.1 Rebeccamycin O-methyltransferase [Propionibacterium australiense]